METIMGADFADEFPYAADDIKDVYMAMEDENDEYIRIWDGVEAGDERVLEARKFYGILDLADLDLPC